MELLLRVKLETNIDQIVEKPEIIKGVLEEFKLEPDEDTVIALASGFLLGTLTEFCMETLGRDLTDDEIVGSRALLGRRIAEIQNALMR